MPDTCQSCDFYIERGLATASSPPTMKSDFNIGRGICRRHAPVLVPDPELPLKERGQFPTVDNEQWCGDYRNTGRNQYSC